MAKRANGDGSVMWSASRGRWLATMTGPDGKQVRKTVPPEIAKTKSERARRAAIAWMLDRKAELWQPAPVAIVAGRLMGEHLDLYLVHLAAIGRRPRTIRSMTSIVKTILRPGIGHIPVDQLEPSHLRALYQQVTAVGKGAGTIHLAHAIVSGALALAVEDRLVPSNVAKRVQTPPVPKRNPPIVGEQIDMARFLRAITGARFEAAFIVALACGLRNHELRALTWADVDTGRREIRITSGTQPAKGGEVRGETKSKSGMRRIAVGNIVLAALRAQRKAVRAMELAAPDWQPNDLVWPSERGTIVNEKKLNDELHRVMAAAKLPALRGVHDLKHAFVTNALEADVDLPTVSRTAGHSSVGVTAGVYGHATRKGDRKLGDAMDAVFGKGKSGPTAKSS